MEYRTRHKVSLYWTLVSVVITLVITAPCRVFAQGSVYDRSRGDTLLLHLKDVEVKADAYRKLPAIIPAQTLGGKQLMQLNAHSVADAVRYFAGVQLKDYGGVGGVKTLDVRSMGTNHLGVFYDGIIIGNAQNGQIDLGKFSLDNIEAVSLYNGQKSEIFQSARDFGSAGTVYLQTRRPVFDEGKNYNLRVTFRTGSFGLANPSILWEQRWSKNVSSSVNAEYTYATGKYKFRYKKVFSDGTLAWDTTAVRQNGDIYALRAEASVFGHYSNAQWMLKAYFYDSEKGIPGAIVNNVWKNAQRQWDRNFFTQGVFRKKLTGWYDFKVSAKYARDYMRYLNPDTTLMYCDNKFWQQEVYLSSVNKFSLLRNWDVNLSVDYHWNTLDSNMANFVHPLRNTWLVALATAYHIKGFSVQASVLGTFVNDRATMLPGSVSSRTKKFNKFTPGVFLSYRPIESQDFTLRAFYKKIFRMPTFNDLYYTDIGNAALNPEYATQIDGGFQYNFRFESSIFSGLDISADGYYNYITDKIIAVPKGAGQYRWMMMNIGKVKIRGLDFSANLHMSLPYGIRIDGGLKYTYQKAQDYSDPTDILDEAGTYKSQIAYIPWHSGSATLHGEWRDLDLNYSFIYVGERYDSSSNIRANYVQPWYTHDMSIGYTFRFGKTRLALNLEINNIFNQQYEVIRNYPMPGRNYKAILKFIL